MDTEKSLLAWLNSNSLSRKCRSLLDLSDLQLIYELLSQIHFSAANLMQNDGSNKVATLVNYRALYHNIEDYYSDVLGTQVDVVCSELSLHDLTYNPTSSRFLPLMELILSIAVQCKDKQTYITRICSLPEGVQSQLMVFIQRALDKSSEGNSDPERIIRAMRREKRQLRADFDSLKTELIATLEELEELSSDKSQGKSKRPEQQHSRRQSLRQSIDVETSIRLEYENQLAGKNEEIELLKKEFGKAETEWKQESRRLQSELDDASSKMELLAELQTTVETYKRKLDDYGLIREELTEAKSMIEQFSRRFGQYQETEQTISQLQHALLTTKDQLKGEKDTVSRLQLALADKEELVQSLSRTEMELREKNGLLSSKNKALLQEVAESNRGLEPGIQSTLGAELEEKMQRLIDENAALKSNRGEDLLIKHYNDELDSALLEKKKAEERCRMLERERTELQNLTEAQKVAMEEEVEKLRKVTDAFREFQQRATMAEAAQKGEIDALQKKLIELRRLNDETERFHREALSSVQEKMTRIKALEGETAKLAAIIKERNESQAIAHTESKPEDAENHLQTLKILELERDLSDKAYQLSTLNAVLSDRDEIISMLKDQQEIWTSTLIRQTEESKGKIREEYEARLLAAVSQNEELAKAAVEQKKCNEALLAEWRREERLFAMVVHSVGAELMHHQLKCHK